LKRTNLEDIEPDPALPLDLGILLATWKDGIREWRDNLGAPPPEAVTWQIYPEGPSIGGILLHLASCDQFWLQEFAEKATLDRTDPAIAYDLSMDQYIPRWPAPPAEPIEWYFDILDRARTSVFASIAQHSDSLSEHPNGEYASTYRWIVAHLVQHDSYHGGQAVLLHETWKKLSASSY